MNNPDYLDSLTGSGFHAVFCRPDPCGKPANPAPFPLSNALVSNLSADISNDATGCCLHSIGVRNRVFWLWNDKIVYGYGTTAHVGCR